MTLYEFNMLEERVKINLVYKEGAYIGKRKQDAYALVLYQVQGFYVEIRYRKYRNHICRIRAFASTFFLDPYLDGMEIENLVGF